MNENRLDVLDGWRGISIGLVLAGHLLPLGPKAFNLNSAVAASGMVIFFILSGFLITSLLLRDGNIKNFLIKRLFRILPLAWLVLAVTFIADGTDISAALRYLTFTSNLPPVVFVDPASHFWSLCVEMQFYLAIAFLVAVLGQRGLIVLPLLALAVTANRIHDQAWLWSDTLHRVDEILAGCTLALLYHFKVDHPKIIKIFGIHPLWIAPLVLVSGHQDAQWFNYFRPYLAMWMVGSTLFVARGDYFTRVLKGRILRYLATISYALYVLHGGMRNTWLGTGDTLVRYLKRPLLLAVTFLLAHLSTFYFERYFMDLARRLTRRAD